MKSTSPRQIFLKTLSLAIISLLFLTATARAGLDSYSIYLNGKLLFSQTVDKAVNLQQLPLDKANPNDRIIIYYSQCNAPNKIGSGRSILLKDGEGKIVREWKFEDVKGGGTAMVISVRDLLNIRQNQSASSLALYYNATGMNAEQRLANL